MVVDRGQSQARAKMMNDKRTGKVSLSKGGILIGSDMENALDTRVTKRQNAINKAENLIQVQRFKCTGRISGARQVKSGDGGRKGKSVEEASFAPASIMFASTFPIAATPLLCHCGVWIGVRG